MVNWLALDIGGANIKIADGAGYSCSAPFPLWRHPERLSEVLAGVISRAAHCDQIAATMTGELADCFATKDDGVRHIVQALLVAAGKRRVRVYRINGQLVGPENALREPRLVAAANWHALASFSARFTNGRNSLLIDIGSTTTDIIPIVNGRPLTAGLTDTERLLNGELVYTGVGRSPVCAVVRVLPYRGQWCPVAQELFATTQDAYLLLDEMPEFSEYTNTVDGRPATHEFAHARLARCLCADTTIFDLKNAVTAAEAIRDKQTAQIANAVAEVVTRQNEPISNVIISGEGEFLARRVVARMEIDLPVFSLGEELGPEVSRCAPAHALAVLAREGSSS